MQSQTITDKVFIRDDDVLVTSSEWPDVVKRFKQVHSWILQAPDIVHIATILVTEIQEFPEIYPYLLEQVTNGSMILELHGLHHWDYGKLKKDEVIDHLEKSKDFMEKTFNVIPTRWYTPWGASQSHLHEAAQECGLKLIDCSNLIELSGEEGVVKQLRRGMPLSFYHGKELFIHWWKRSQHLNRVCGPHQ